MHFVWIPIVGAISDRVGRRPLYLLGAVGVAVWSFVFFDLSTQRQQSSLILAVVVGLMLHALMYAPQAAFFSELFGTSVRYTGASVGLPARVDLRRGPRTDHRGEAARRR